MVANPVLAKFGIRGDGVSNDGPALQRALDARPSLLELPAGHYTTAQTLHIHGGTRLLLDPQAVIRLADKAAKTTNDYLLTNANPESGDRYIAIEGGFWDGNNPGNPRPAGLFDDGYSGALLHFQNVDGLRLENARLHNAEAYHARFTHVRNFHVEKIRFSADHIRPNNDGIHLGGNCSDGVIRDIKGLHPGVTGDDMIALNADDALKRTEVRGMTNGPIRNITIEDIEAEGCHSFVRLLSVWSTIENISIRGVRGTCEVAAINCDAARGCRVPVFDEKNPPFPDGVGDLRRITAFDFHVAKSKNNDIALLRMETRLKDFTISLFLRDLDRDQAKNTPTLRLRHIKAHYLLRPGNIRGQTSLNDTFESNAPIIDRLELVG
jgi:hypothetical protein